MSGTTTPTVSIDTTQQVQATLTFTGTQPAGVPAWSFPDGTVATVTPAADGLSAVVASVSPGTATLTVTLDTLTATATVTVTEALTMTITFGTPTPKA